MVNCCRNQTWNIFDPLSNSEDLIQYIKGSEQSLRTGKLTSLDAILRTKFNNNNIAIGLQLNDEALDVKYNELARSEFDQSGNLIKGADLLFLGGGKNISSDRNKKALFFELEKIFSENLDVLFATRYEKVENDSSFDPKLSINFRPNDKLLIRGSVGTSFSTPSMAQLFSSEIALGGVRDVINGVEQSSSLFVRVIQMGNPNLKPATSTNSNLGLFWNLNDNISLSADFWKINYKDRLELEDAQTKIIENPENPDIQRNELGDITAVSTTFFNEEKTKVKGLDINFNYKKTLSNQTTLDLGINATHLFDYLTPEHEEAGDHEDEHESHMVNRVGRFNYNAHTHSLPRLRLNAFFGLTHNGIRYSVNTRYLDGYTNLRPLPAAAVSSGYENEVDSFLVFDIGASKIFQIENGELKLGLHLMNAFDESAPLLYDSPDFSFDTRLHDPRGRLINLSLDYEF